MSSTVRRSLLGAVVGGLAFGSVILYRSIVAEGSVLQYLSPMAMMVVIGATVGGLVGPLVGEAWARTRGSRPDVNSREGSVPGPSAPEEETLGADRQPAPGQPLWATLLVGVVVGYGIGVAWSSVPVGVGFGLLLAVAARRIFR